MKILVTSADSNLLQVTAILAAHLSGQEVGNSIVDVLWGDVNPSGKLPYTIAHKEEVSPSYRLFAELYLPLIGRQALGRHLSVKVIDTNSSVFLGLRFCRHYQLYRATRDRGAVRLASRLR